MKVYVTKYALTAGIEAVEVEYGRGDQKYVYRKTGAPSHVRNRTHPIRESAGTLSMGRKEVAE